MTGFLAVNHYLSGEKFSELHSHLISSAEKMNIDLRLRTNFDLLFEEENPDFVLFWDKDINCAKMLENRKWKFRIPEKMVFPGYCLW